MPRAWGILGAHGRRTESEIPELYAGARSPVKLFVTASPEVRARRRTEELLAKGRGVRYETILAEVHERDRRDAGRSVAPLKPAEDARLLDTSELGIEEAFRAACAIIDATRS